jgi:hypothetical protein
MQARAALGCRTNRNPGETSTASQARNDALGSIWCGWAASVESDFTKRGSKGLLSRLVLLPHPLYRSPFPLLQSRVCREISRFEDNYFASFKPKYAAASRWDTGAASPACRLSQQNPAIGRGSLAAGSFCLVAFQKKAFLKRTQMKR